MSTIAQNEEDDETFEKIKKGFKVNHIQMKNGENGEVMWEVKSWDLNKVSHTENITKELLKCKRIIRNVNFSSEEKIDELELVQNFYLMGELFESSRFKFGFVIPGSTNDWEQIMIAKQDGVLPVEVLSGKLQVETLFLIQGKVLYKNKILIYYV
jgi:retinal rod rhodopsin-sensitive cGMP 3',5'-cyclic phosphodiesterase subunit delta